jgi:hypothetical protein
MWGFNMSNTPDNSDDIIDSCDVIARIEELESERDDAQEESESALVSWLDENATELNALLSLADEASDYAPDWHQGETLIRDSYFKNYAIELAEDCGAPISNEWPMRCIDWDQAARELQMDYTSVDFDGVTYWIR